MTITEEDLKRLKKVFPTREEMNRRFDAVDQRFDESDKKWEKKWSDMVSSQDYIVKLLETRRDEDAIAAAEDRLFRRQLEDHELRIGRLETHSK